MKIKYLCTVFLVLLPFIIKTQNLVPNASFENGSPKPSGQAQLDRLN